MRLGCGSRCDACDFIHTSRNSFLGFVGRLLDRVEEFDGANDGSIPVVHWNRAYADRNLMSGFVMKKAASF